MPIAPPTITSATLTAPRCPLTGAMTTEASRAGPSLADVGATWDKNASTDALGWSA